MNILHDLDQAMQAAGEPIELAGGQRITRLQGPEATQKLGALTGPASTFMVGEKFMAARLLK